MIEATRDFLDASPEITSSGVSWGAVFAGAVGAASLSLILLLLGMGLGFSTISPWPNGSLGGARLGSASIAWLILTQIAASGMGGYLAGRLRVKWTAVHTDEVYFRDTAHGFLAWAVASLAVAILIGAVLGKAMSGVATGTRLTANAMGLAAASASGAAGNSEGMMKYMVDSLFRPAPAAPDTVAESDAAVHLEAGRIFVNSMHSDKLPPQDEQYLAQVVAKRTGLSAADADKRVGDTFNIVRGTIAGTEQSARQAAEHARKAAAYSALWMFVSLLCGAFIASLAATLGGRQRDQVLHAP